MTSTSNKTSGANTSPASTQAERSPSCRPSGTAAGTPGEVRCPVCYHLIPPEQIGYKLHCRRCGYLESCCNPI